MSPNTKRQNQKRKKGVAQRTPKQQITPPLQPVKQSVAYAQAKPFRQTEPKIKSSARGCVIEHREPIGYINQTGANFTIHLDKPLNPGLPETFKWLSNQAVCWEKYWFEYLEFEYLARCPATNTGAVMLAIDHDAADGAPASEDVMMNFHGSSEDSVWVKSLTAKLRVDRQRRFTRFAPLAANLDVKTYDAGRFFGATSGVGSSASAAGKVYVRYKVHFEIPQLPPNFAFGSGSFSGGGTMTAANPLGTVPVSSQLANGVSVNDQSRVTFRDIGNYLSTLSVNGTGISNMNSPTVVSGSATVGDPFGAFNGAGTAGLVKDVINIIQPNTVLDYAITGTTVTGSHLDIAAGAGLE